jgi:probable F420-dependent oxidoreductase
LTLRFVYHYPETTGTEGDMLDPGRIQEVAARVESAGLDGLALTEHPVPGARWLDAGGHQSLDPFVALGAAAAATSRIRLLTHLSVAPYRNPFLLAKAAATVDKISDGRMILGLGAGYHRTEFRALGVDMEERNALFDETLDVLPLHWAGEPFSYQGRHFEAREVIARPRPVQVPIPIWIGGNSKASRRRVVEKAQGWMPMLGPPSLSATARTAQIGSLEELAPLVAELHEAATTAGRTEPIDVLCSYRGPSMAAPANEPDRHREAFEQIEKMGIKWVLLSSNTRSAPATFEWLAEFGETYLA